MSLQKPDYISTLQQLKDKIRQARTRAAFAVNAELLEVYWEIGNTVLQQQEIQGWGTKVIEKLAADLKAEFTDMKGFSVRNLKYMRAFAGAYPLIRQQDAAQLQDAEIQSNEIVQGAPAQFKNGESGPFVQAQLAQLSWYHHCTILDKVKEPQLRLFYIQQTIQNGWSRDVMVHQIEGGLHNRIGKVSNNFKNTILPEYSELVQQVFKDPYKFEFIYLGQEAKEKDVENAMLTNITKVLLELGSGFSYMGRQLKLEAGGREFFLDLLFYHTKLRRHIIVELKIGDFEPEFISKMNVYLGMVDDQLKGEFDEPAIGLILCKTKNKTIVEYALRDTSKPIGIAEYKIAEQLPADIKGDLPSIEELETEIDKSYEELKSPQQSKLDLLKEKLSKVSSKPIEQPLTFDNWVSVFNKSLIPLFHKILSEMEVYREFYLNQNYFWSGDNNITDIDTVAEKWTSEGYFKGQKSFYFHYGFWALKQSGTDAWNDSVQLHIKLEPYWYGLSLNSPQNNFISKKLYTEQLTPEEINQITEQLCNSVNRRIEEYIIWKEANPQK